MKKVILFVLAGLICGQLFAQEPDAASKNAGNEAWKAKNFKDAFMNFEKYLESVNFSDKAYIYNTAVAANKINNYAAAVKYFDMSVKNNYKLASSYLGKAKAEEDMKKTADMLKTLEAGLKALPGNDKLENMYGNYFLKAGRDAQQANNLTKAAESYLKATTLASSDIKVTAFSALTSLHFNNGAAILQKATPHANTNKDLYASEKEKANGEFKSALDYASKAQAIAPENQDVKNLIAEIQKAMK
ncbi:hypothetical protein LJB94_00750 [Odoribacter sp. OttesenSCG-928-G04]|nr:hypothetical protein [Odoribacter sp. OttesenSCG-928-G04]MDL2331068.1 hypothetical protein [Odoribacter sp. OttesenSCG-928-A06]